MKIFNPMPWLGGPRAIAKSERRRSALLCAFLIILGSGAVGGAIIGTIIGAMSPPALAQPTANEAGQDPSSPINYPPGLCFRGQRDISGSWVNDGTGTLVPLDTLCDVAIQHQERISIPPGETDFWQAFITAASPDALDFANEVQAEDVIAYGQTICPSLHELGTMHELRLVQAEGGLPASFDAAVNVAAIHTYCPEKARTIGR